MRQKARAKLARTWRGAPSLHGSCTPSYDCRSWERCGAGHRAVPSLTAQCQDIAASARQDDYSPNTPAPEKALNQNRILILCAGVLWGLRSTAQESCLIILTSLGSERTGASQEPSESDWEVTTCRNKQTTVSEPDKCISSFCLTDTQMSRDFGVVPYGLKIGPHTIYSGSE